MLLPNQNSFSSFSLPVSSFSIINSDNYDLLYQYQSCDKKIYIDTPIRQSHSSISCFLNKFQQSIRYHSLQQIPIKKVMKSLMDYSLLIHPTDLLSQVPSLPFLQQYELILLFQFTSSPSISYDCWTILDPHELPSTSLSLHILFHWDYSIHQPINKSIQQYNPSQSSQSLPLEITLFHSHSYPSLTYYSLTDTKPIQSHSLSSIISTHSLTNYIQSFHITCYLPSFPVYSYSYSYSIRKNKLIIILSILFY